jgi:hypothetical protein
MCAGFNWLKGSLITSSGEYGNETLVYIKDGEFLDQKDDY